MQFDVPALNMLSTNPYPVTPVANGYNANLQLSAFGARFYRTVFAVPALPAVSLGQFITYNTQFAPGTPDVYPGNNAASTQVMIMGSYDPNDIQESHGPQIVSANFGPDDYLQYTVRFENTGNGIAENVKVLSLLDSRLDETSYRPRVNSRSMIAKREGNQMTWSFNGINLSPAGVANNSAYFIFDIKPKPGFAPGDIIPITARIFFDSNPPIITNTWQTEFVETLKTDAFVAGDVKLHPNPVQNQLTVSAKEVLGSVTVYDIFGKVLLQQQVAAKETALDVSGLASGLYLVKTGQGQTFKILKQ